MTDDPAPTAPGPAPRRKPAPAPRADRLAAALRANVARRKAQARARQDRAEGSEGQDDGRDQDHG